jgi:NADPH:quinone reductase
MRAVVLDAPGPVENLHIRELPLPEARPGTVCFTGMLSNQWTVKDFYPIDYLPRGVRLSAYGGDAADLPAQILQEFLDAATAGTAIVPIDHVYPFDQIVQAHTAMQAGHTKGKLVITT